MSARASWAILFLALAAAPASARDQSRAERSAGDVARPVEAAAGAVGTGPVRRSVGSVRFRGAERLAVERCAPHVERYGRMRIDDVRPQGRGGWRVYGTVGGAAIGDSSGWRRGYAPRAFTCTVREDGRVRLKTSKLRMY